MKNLLYRNSFSKRSDSALLMLILPFLIYIVVVIKSNFQVDDFGSVILGEGALHQHILDWKFLWGMRPFGLLLFPALINVFQSHPVLYTSLNLALYIFALLLLCRVLFGSNKKLFYSIGVPALCLSLLPAMADTFVYSSVNQMCQSVSLLLMVAGIYMQTQKNAGGLNQVHATILFTASLLTYEIWLPLLVFALFDPKRKIKNQIINKKFSSLLPIIIPLAIAFLWQKFFVVLFLGDSNSRLAGFKYESLISYFYTWVFELPLKLYISTSKNVLIFSIILLFILSFWISERRKVNHVSTEFFVFPFALSFLVMAILFSVSGRIATSYGYDNRGMTSSWVIFSFLIATVLQKNFRFVIYLLIALNTTFFIQTLLDFDEASGIRNRITNQTVSNVSTLMRDEESVEPFVIYANVPCALQNGINQPNIFCTTWDMGPAVNMKLGSNLRIYPLQNMIWGNPPRIQRDSGVSSTNGESLLINFTKTGMARSQVFFRSDADLEDYLSKSYNKVFEETINATPSEYCQSLQSLAMWLARDNVEHNAITSKLFYNGFCRVYLDPVE